MQDSILQKTSQNAFHAAQEQMQISFCIIAGCLILDGLAQDLLPCVCRCAANDQMDDNTALVGAPAYMPMTSSNHQYYFVTLSLDSSQQSRSSVSSIRSQITGKPYAAV